MSATVSVGRKLFTERIGRIEVSATMAVTAEAARLKAQGIDLVDFGAGGASFCHASAYQGRGDCGDRGEFYEVHGGAGDP